MFFCKSSKIGFNVLSADLKSGAFTRILYFGAPMYNISTPPFCSASCNCFFIFSIPLKLISDISNIPLISTDGSLILDETSSIISNVSCGKPNVSKTLIPFVPISITAS